MSYQYYINDAGYGYVDTQSFNAQPRYQSQSNTLDLSKPKEYFENKALDGLSNYVKKQTRTKPATVPKIDLDAELRRIMPEKYTYTAPTSFSGKAPTTPEAWRTEIYGNVQRGIDSNPHLSPSQHIAKNSRDVDHLVDLRNDQLGKSWRTRGSKTAGGVVSKVPTGKYLGTRAAAWVNEDYYADNLGVPKDERDPEYKRALRKASGRDGLHEIGNLGVKNVKSFIRRGQRAALDDVVKNGGQHLQRFAEHAAPHATEAAEHFWHDEKTHLAHVAGPMATAAAIAKQAHGGYTSTNDRLQNSRNISAEKSKSVWKKLIPSMVTKALHKSKNRRD
jgi:hypothetical protein